MAADLVGEVRAFFTGQVCLKPGSKLLVAVSGGVDSMVLLDVLDRLRGELQVRLHAAHLDHGLRPQAGADRKWVEGQVLQRGLECSSDRIDVGAYRQQHRLSLEDAARQVRYCFLDQTAKKIGADSIVLGHHADDQAETVLMRLLRGSGASGLKAMRPVRAGRYLRPLLNIERRDIGKYARKESIAYREDGSNRDLRFVRNRIRHQLIPHLQQHYNGSIVRVLGRTARLLAAEDQVLAQTAATALAAVKIEAAADKIELAAPRFLDYHIAIQRRIARAVLEGLSSGGGPFAFEQIELLLACARGERPGLCDLGREFWSQLVGQRLIVRRGKTGPFERAIEVPGKTAIAQRNIVLESKCLPRSAFDGVKADLGGTLAAFDAQRLGSALQVRSLKPGDRFLPLGMKGRKKISDFLIDIKWPRILRDQVLVLVGGGEIAWILGSRTSHTFRVRADTKVVLLLEVLGLDDPV